MEENTILTEELINQELCSDNVDPGDVFEIWIKTTKNGKQFFEAMKSDIIEALLGKTIGEVSELIK